MSKRKWAAISILATYTILNDDEEVKKIEKTCVGERMVEETGEGRVLRKTDARITC